MKKCVADGCKQKHDIFVFTEVFGCGEIGEIFAQSYLRQNSELNDLPIHVFGYKNDLEKITSSPNIIKVRLKPFGLSGLKLINEYSIRYLYKRGHAGTAALWTYVIRESKQKYIIHIDSDTVLLGDIVNDLANELTNNEIDLIGPARPYKHNSQKIQFEDDSPDLVQTCIFGFNTEKIDTKRPMIEMFRMVLGTFSPIGRKILDFFDPVSLEILGNRGKIAFLNHDDVGGLNLLGSRRNKYPELNDFPTIRKIDVGDKFIHFSAVGTGINVFNNPKNSIPHEYAEYALDRYALYSTIFLDDDLKRDLSEYAGLIRGLKNLTKSN